MKLGGEIFSYKGCFFCPVPISRNNFSVFQNLPDYDIKLCLVSQTFQSYFCYMQRAKNKKALHENFMTEIYEIIKTVS